MSELQNIDPDSTAGHPPADAAQPFEADTLDAAAAMRSTFCALVSALPGEFRKAAQLQRLLNVDYKICWQVFNVVQAPDLLTAARHAPSMGAFRRFLNSAGQLGVNDRVLEAARTAVTRLGDVIKTHADDRNTFRSMVSAMSAAQGGSETELQHRRSAYRAMTQICGTQTDIHTVTCMIRKSACGLRIDECMLTGKCGLRRLRPDVSPMVYGFRYHSSAVPGKVFLPKPIDPAAAATHGVPILPAFCSQPIPPLRINEGADGWTYVELVGEGIGRRSAANLMFGGIALDVPYSTDTDGRHYHESSISIRMPTGLYVCDLLVHRPSFGEITPELMAFQSSPEDLTPAGARSAPQLPLSERIIRVGRADQVTANPDFPQLPPLLHQAARSLNWNLAEFDVFRTRVEYPVFGSVIRKYFHFE